MRLCKRNANESNEFLNAVLSNTWSCCCSFFMIHFIPTSTQEVEALKELEERTVMEVLGQLCWDCVGNNGRMRCLEQ